MNDVRDEDQGIVRTEAPRRGSVKHGVLLLMLLHLLQLVWLLDEPVMIWLTGMTQVAYLLPASIVLLVQKRWATLGGLWIAAVATVVLNMALAGIVCGGTTGIGG